MIRNIYMSRSTRSNRRIKRSTQRKSQHVSYRRLCNPYISQCISQDISVDSNVIPNVKLDLQFEKIPKLEFTNDTVKHYMLQQFKYPIPIDNTDLSHQQWGYVKALCRMHVYLKSSQKQKENYNYTFLNIYKLLSYNFNIKGINTILGLDITNTLQHHTSDTSFYKRRLSIYVDAIQSYILRKYKHVVNTYSIRYLTFSDLHTYDSQSLHRRHHEWHG